MATAVAALALATAGCDDSQSCHRRQPMPPT